MPGTIDFMNVAATEPRPPITLIVLAAGGSSRLGNPKQLARIGGASLIRRAVQTALDSGLGPVIVVVGAAADAVSAEIRELAVRVVENRDWAEGMSTSIRTGVRAAGLESSVLLILVDQPGVTAGHLRALASALRPPSVTIVGTECGVVVPPALFDARHRDALCALAGDRGAKAVIEANATSMTTVRLDGARLDIDTPEDLHRAESELAAGE